MRRLVAELDPKQNESVNAAFAALLQVVGG